MKRQAHPEKPDLKKYNLEGVDLSQLEKEVKEHNYRIEFEKNQYTDYVIKAYKDHKSASLKPAAYAGAVLVLLYFIGVALSKEPDARILYAGLILIGVYMFYFVSASSIFEFLEKKFHDEVQGYCHFYYGLERANEYFCYAKYKNDMKAYEYEKAKAEKQNRRK